MHITDKKSDENGQILIIDVKVNDEKFLLVNPESSHPELFLGKGFLKIFSKFKGEHPYRSANSIKVFSEHLFLTKPVDGCVKPLNSNTESEQINSLDTSCQIFYRKA